MQKQVLWVEVFENRIVSQKVRSLSPTIPDWYGDTFFWRGKVSFLNNSWQAKESKVW